MARRSQRRSLRLDEFSDRELLALVRDHEDSDGWANSLTVAEAIWPKYAAENPVHARMSVAQRFGWMRRWGVMERHGKETGLWRLTEHGRLVVEGRLSAGQLRTIEGIEDGRLMSLGYALSDRYQEAEDAPAILFRRAMQFAQTQRKRRIR